MAVFFLAAFFLTAFLTARPLLDRFDFAAVRPVFRPPFATFAPPLAFRLAIALILSEP
jgi:hypothetical protein